MLVVKCFALFLSGAIVGASIDHWFMGSRLDLGYISASLLIAVLVSAQMKVGNPDAGG